MLRLTQLRFAAIAAMALAAALLTGQFARAFTTENLRTSSDGSSRYADPDNQVKNYGQGQGYQPLGPNGPTMQFNPGQSPMSRPFGPRYMPPASLGCNNN